MDDVKGTEGVTRLAANGPSDPGNRLDQCHGFLFVRFKLFVPFTDCTFYVFHAFYAFLTIKCHRIFLFLVDDPIAFPICLPDAGKDPQAKIENKFGTIWQ